jgi:hypothetical protein
VVILRIFLKVFYIEINLQVFIIISIQGIVRAFKIFLNVSPQITNWSSDSKEFSILLEDNPLSEFVELPDQYAGLWYSNILWYLNFDKFSGVIRGSLEMVHVQVECFWVQDMVRGDSANELRVKWIKNMDEEAPIDDE